MFGVLPLSSTFYGFRYYAIFVDHFSKSAWLYPKKLKSNLFIIFPKICAMLKNISKLSWSLFILMVEINIKA